MHYYYNSLPVQTADTYYAQSTFANPLSIYDLKPNSNFTRQGQPQIQLPTPFKSQLQQPYYDASFMTTAPTLLNETYLSSTGFRNNALAQERVMNATTPSAGLSHFDRCNGYCRAKPIVRKLNSPINSNGRFYYDNHCESCTKHKHNSSGGKEFMDDQYYYYQHYDQKRSSALQPKLHNKNNKSLENLLDEKYMRNSKSTKSKTDIYGRISRTQMGNRKSTPEKAAVKAVMKTDSCTSPINTPSSELDKNEPKSEEKNMLTQPSPLVGPLPPPPPPAPPIDLEIFKCNETVTTTLVKNRKVTGRLNEEPKLAKNFDAVVSELKSKLDKIRTNDENVIKLNGLLNKANTCSANLNSSNPSSSTNKSTTNESSNEPPSLVDMLRNEKTRLKPIEHSANNSNESNKLTNDSSSSLFVPKANEKQRENVENVYPKGSWLLSSSSNSSHSDQTNSNPNFDLTDLTSPSSVESTNNNVCGLKQKQNRRIIESVANSFKLEAFSDNSDESDDYTKYNRVKFSPGPQQCVVTMKKSQSENVALSSCLLYKQDEMSMNNVHSTYSMSSKELDNLQTFDDSSAFTNLHTSQNTHKSIEHLNQTKHLNECLPIKQKSVSAFSTRNLFDKSKSSLAANRHSAYEIDIDLNKQVSTSPRSIVQQESAANINKEFKWKPKAEIGKSIFIKTIIRTNKSNSNQSVLNKSFNVLDMATSKETSPQMVSQTQQRQQEIVRPKVTRIINNNIFAKPASEIQRNNTSPKENASISRTQLGAISNIQANRLKEQEVSTTPLTYSNNQINDVFKSFTNATGINLESYLNPANEQLLSGIYDYKTFNEAELNYLNNMESLNQSSAYTDNTYCQSSDPFYDEILSSSNSYEKFDAENQRKLNEYLFQLFNKYPSFNLNSER